MRLLTTLRSRWLFASLAGATLLFAFILWQTSYERRFLAAEEAFAQWRMHDAESLLESLTHDHPEHIEAQRLYASTLLRRGELHTARRAFTALASTDTALSLSHRLSLALTHFYLGNLDSTVSLVGRILHSSSHDSHAIAAAYHLLGRVEFNRGSYDSALSHQQQSLSFARAAGDAQLEADALRQLGVLFWYNGKTDSARTAFYEPALELYRKVNDKIGEATTLNNLALLRFDPTLYLEAFAIRKQIGDQIGISDSYYFLTYGIPAASRWSGNLYSFRKKSLRLSSRIGYAWGMEVAKRALQEILFQSTDSPLLPDAEIDSVADLSAEGKILQLLLQSSDVIRKNDWHAASKMREEAFRLADSLGFPVWRVLSLYATALAGAGEFHKAESVAVEAQRIGKGKEWTIGNPLADVLMYEQRYDQAAPLLHQTIRQLDEVYVNKLRERDPIFSFNAAQWLAARYELFDMLFTALSRSGTSEQLFAALEQVRSLAPLLDLEPGSKAGEENIGQKFIRVADKIEDSPEDMETIETLMSEFNEAYAASLARSALASEASAFLSNETIPRLEDVQKKLRDEDALLEFFVGSKDVYALVVRRNAASFVSLHDAARNVNSSVRVLQSMILRAKILPGDSLWKGPARFLFSALIKPMRRKNLLTGCKHLLISPHGVLHYAPFAALLDSSGRFLVQQNDISYVPSATLLVAKKKRLSTSALLALLPDKASLPFAEKEINSIPRNRFRYSNVLAGSEATANALLTHASNSDVIHIAAHGSMDRWHPLFSPIQLADGPFELHRILPMQLSARLVVVSACETGYATGMLGDVAKGHHAINFPFAFLTAGASSVLAPMWLVEDEASAELVSSFYTYLELQNRIDGRSLSHALAQAQRGFIRNAQASGRKDHPFFWAGYALTGL